MPSDLEDLLRRVPLRRPSEDLDRRVLAEAAAPAARPRVFRWAATALAAAAAVALAVAGWQWLSMQGNEHHKAYGPASPGVVQADGHDEPIRIEQVWSAVEPRGVVMIDDQTPARGFVRRTVNRVQVIDEKQNIRVEYTIPREDYVYVPVGYD
jgi:hypothetical protein